MSQLFDKSSLALAGTIAEWTYEEFLTRDEVVSIEIDIDGKQDALTFDATPTANSGNPVTSGGIYNALTTAAAASVDVTRLTGVIDISHIPPAAIERIVVVADDAARFDLTTATAQNGDTVKVMATGLMYAVIDDTHLDTAAGYMEYTAGEASAVEWAGVRNKPTTLTGYGVTATDPLLAAKVDAEQGKGLSTEDYTTAEKTKLSGIEAGAQVNPSPFTGATAQAAGTAGLVPAPASGVTGGYLKSDGTWADLETAVQGIVDDYLPDGWNVPFGGVSNE